MSGEFSTLPPGWAPQPDSLRERVILITGASGGLGRTCALAAARAGASVILLGRKVRALEKVYDEITAAAAPTPAIYPLDLSGATPHDYAQLATTMEREFGRLDGIVHAAAHFDGLRPASDIGAEEWMRALHVNLTAPFLLTQACLPLLQAGVDTSVVFVMDDPQRMGRAYWGGYGAAKHALAGLACILHEETENSTLRVHALLPAPMRTALRRVAYFGENTLALPTPEATADAAVYLLSAAAAQMRGRVLDLRAEPPRAY
jgi:NAD(P)-dependent dehydrogenase (short-subunit alcohol dehydrogenase family)